MNALAKLDQLLDQLEQRREYLRNKKMMTVRRSLIRCSQCRQNSQLTKFTFVQLYRDKHTHIFVGGYEQTQAAFVDCLIICPKCEKINRIFIHPQKEKIITLVDESGFKTEDIFDFVERKKEADN